MSDLPNVGGAPAAPAPASESPAPKDAGAPPASSARKPATPDEPDAWEAEYQAEMAKVRKEKEATADRARAEDERQQADRERREKEERGEEVDDDEQEEKQPQKKVKTYKVNGKDVQVDLSDESKVDQYVQKGLAADEKFAKAAKIEKQAMQFVQNLRDPSQLFKMLAHPAVMGDPKAVRAAAEKYLYEEFQRESMPEEERQRLAEREELERYRAQQADEKQQRDHAAKEQTKETLRQDFTKKFIAALDQGGVPKTDWTVKRMAEYMRVAISKGHKHIQPADVVEFVRNDWAEAQRQLLSSLDGENLIKVLGKDTAEKIRRHDVQQFKQDRSKNGQFTQARSAPQPTSTKTYSSTEELREALAAKGRSSR